MQKYFQFHTGNVFEIGDGPGDTSDHAEEHKRADLTGGLDVSVLGGKEHIQLAFGGSRPIIECPELDEVISRLGQLEPNLLIISNFNLKCSLTLQQIIENSTVPRSNIVVLCSPVTIPKVEFLGVRIIDTKFEIGKNLIPVVQELLS